ncbi:MAG: FAD-binding protein, partial [Myxococcales bacterium]|nr:FAD-binding protein [Myxococcales bacterium]
MLSASYDVGVVGGGPAGTSLAIQLAEAGARVLLVEKKPPPRDKLCGEFLSPEARLDLARLKVLDEISTKGASMHEARFTVPSGAESTFALPAPGLGVSRLLLDATLWERARGAGARLLEDRVRAIEAAGTHAERASRPCSGALRSPDAAPAPTEAHRERVQSTQRAPRRGDRRARSTLYKLDERAPSKGQLAARVHELLR